MARKKKDKIEVESKEDKKKPEIQEEEHSHDTCPSCGHETDEWFDTLMGNSNFLELMMIKMNMDLDDAIEALGFTAGRVAAENEIDPELVLDAVNFGMDVGVDLGEDRDVEGDDEELPVSKAKDDGGFKN